MNAPIRRTLAALAVAALTLGATAFAQAPMPVPPPPASSGGQYEPNVGQQGKDVIWVPTPQELVDRMLDIAKVTPRDFLIDLGSGDGRTVITAAKRGLNALGIEYEPPMVELARRRAAEAGVADKAKFEKADLYETDLSRAQVITLFLLPTINEKLRPKLLELQPGTRIVSNTFPMGDWAPDDRADLPAPCSTWCTALLWIIPAKIDGEWQAGGEPLKISQKYQQFTGSLGSQSVTDGVLKGRDVTFSVGDRRYVAVVEGDQLRGRVHAADGSQRDWTARRR